MTRRSKREIERALEELGAGNSDRALGRPLTDEEMECLGDSAEAWNKTPITRRMIRCLALAASGDHGVNT